MEFGRYGHVDLTKWSCQDNVHFETCGIGNVWNWGVVISETCGLGGALKELVSSTVRPDVSACLLHRDSSEYRIGSMHLTPVPYSC